MSHDTLTNEQWRDDRIAEVEADRDEWKARCLAAEAAVKHHEHYVKTSVSIVADCEGELSKLRVAARQLVSSLPRCTHPVGTGTCANVATRVLRAIVAFRTGLCPWSDCLAAMDAYVASLSPRQT